jgi:hypothetical protein
MPLTADQRSDILAYLDDEAETTGEDIGLDFILDRWDTITNPLQMERKSLHRELRQLRDQRPILRAQLDALVARIAEIDAILTP